MLIVKCKECGQEYELENGNNPSDFECNCGGELGYADAPENHLVEETYSNESVVKYSRTVESSGMIHSQKKAIEYITLTVVGLIMIIFTVIFIILVLSMGFRFF